jgi:hypothetical protein
VAEEPQQELHQAIDLYPEGAAGPGPREHPYQLALPLDDYGERWVKDPRHYAAQLHAGGRGTVALAQRYAGRWLERTYPVEAAVAAANAYRGRADVYLSTQRFRGRRRLAKLLSLSSLYADLDYYRMPELERVHPYSVMASRRRRWRSAPAEASTWSGSTSTSSGRRSHAGEQPRTRSPAPYCPTAPTPRPPTPPGYSGWSAPRTRTS